MRIQYRTRERESHKQDFLNLCKEGARISTDAPLNGTIGEPKAEVFKLDNLFSPSQQCWKKSKREGQGAAAPEQWEGAGEHPTAALGQAVEGLRSASRQAGTAGDSLK